MIKTDDLDEYVFLKIAKTQCMTHYGRDCDCFMKDICDCLPKNPVDFDIEYSEKNDLKKEFEKKIADSIAKNVKCDRKTSVSF